MAKSITVSAEQTGKRVDVVAGELLPTLSRAFIRRLIDDGRITVNKESSKAGAKVREGDQLQTDFEERDLSIIEPIDLPIIYEDKNVLVVNKPVGVISHSRGKFWNEPSVASFVRQKTNQVGDRAGIVHRLDRATSGVMICAKNSATLAWLQKQFSQRRVQKTYIAIVSGHLNEPEAIIDMPIERNPKAPATFRVAANGRAAQTNYQVLQTTNQYSLLELKPLTGRTHQLRVHLRHLGHPIVGDELYNGAAGKRLYLHALSLQIRLPNNELHTFEAPLPPDFNALLENDRV